MLANESVSTNLRRDFKTDKKETLSLKSMYNVYMNEDALKKYEDKFDQLKKVNKNAEKLRGCMYFLDGDLVAFVSIELRSGKSWIDTLEVVKKYRGRHLSTQLLDVAVKKFGATDLRVNKDNEKAIGIFKTYGFKTYDKKGTWLYMSLREDASKIDTKEDEKAQPITDNFKSKKVKSAKLKSTTESGGLNMNYEYDDQTLDTFLEVATESIFAKKSVDDLLKYARKKLIRSLKTESQCDAYLEQIKNESTKFNEAVSTLMSTQAKFAAGKIDKVTMRKTLASSLKLLNNNCKLLKIRLGDVIDDKKAITRQDIATFATYVKGLNKIVKEIKAARKKGIAIESTIEYDENDEFFEALEAQMDINLTKNPPYLTTGDIIEKKIARTIDASDTRGEGYTAAKLLVKKIKKTTAKLAADPSNAKLKSKLKELKARLEVINNKRKKAGYYAITEGCKPCGESCKESADGTFFDNLFEDIDMDEAFESVASSDDIALYLSIDDMMALEASDLPDDEDGAEVKEEIEDEEDDDEDKKCKKSKKKCKGKKCKKSDDEEDEEEDSEDEEDEEEDDEEDEDEADESAQSDARKTLKSSRKIAKNRYLTAEYLDQYSKSPNTSRAEKNAAKTAADQQRHLANIYAYGSNVDKRRIDGGDYKKGRIRDDKTRSNLMLKTERQMQKDSGRDRAGAKALAKMNAKEGCAKESVLDIFDYNPDYEATESAYTSIDDLFE